MEKMVPVVGGWHNFGRAYEMENIAVAIFRKFAFLA
jgi:hypothetical protein